jgi:hypothetical protein
LREERAEITKPAFGAAYAVVDGTPVDEAVTTGRSGRRCEPFPKP